MTTKYYLKEKCTTCQAFDDNAPHLNLARCNGKGYIRGVDVTELIERYLELKLIDKRLWVNVSIIISFEDLIEAVEE